MPLHPRDATALDTLVADCRRLFGPRLVALALYGEAATAAYRPLVSPLDTVLLLDRVATADLRTLRERVGTWQALRLSVPLVLDGTHLTDASDVFPLEMLELRLLEGRAQLREAGRGLPALERRARLLEPGDRLLVRGVGGQPRILRGDRLLDPLDLHPSELRLVVLPGPAEEVVVRDRPEARHEEQQGQDQPHARVRALFLVDDGIATRHDSADVLRSISRPA